MQRRLPVLLVAAGAVAALASCGDPTALEARLTNIEVNGEAIYSLNGAPITLPTALRVRSASVLPATSDFLFDLAFDITDTGTINIYTARHVATELTGTINRVGLLDLPGQDFATLIDPPRSGFVYDSMLTVPIGRTVVVDVFDISCQTEFLLGFQIKAKLRIDSIVPADDRIHFHMVSNPNCGFNELVPGNTKPKE
jgi:hypothetical protein